MSVVLFGEREMSSLNWVNGKSIAVVIWRECRLGYLTHQPFAFKTTDAQLVEMDKYGCKFLECIKLECQKN